MRAPMEHGRRRRLHVDIRTLVYGRVECVDNDTDEILNSFRHVARVETILEIGVTITQTHIHICRSHLVQYQQ
jgi:hypothetical protein